MVTCIRIWSIILHGEGFNTFISIFLALVHCTVNKLPKSRGWDDSTLYENLETGRLAKWSFATDEITYTEILAQNLARYVRLVDGFDYYSTKEKIIYRFLDSVVDHYHIAFFLVKAMEKNRAFEYCHAYAEFLTTCTPFTDVWKKQ